jgi:hypothetical protein
MAKKLAKILIMGVLIIMSLGLFAGCEGNKYNAVILDNFSANLKEGFFEMTFSIKDEPEGLDEWWNDDTDGWWNYGSNGKELIHKRVLVIKEKNEADIAFDNFPSNFDFEKEMLLLCFFAEPSQWIESPSAYTLKEMMIDGSTLKFILDIKGYASSAQGRSIQRCKIIKMKKLDITAAEFSISIKP